MIKPGYKKTELGLLPVEWNDVKLGDIFSERHVFESIENYPLYSLSIENGVTEKTERYERSHLIKGNEKNQYKLVYENDFVYNPMNIRFGAIDINKNLKRVLVSIYYDVFYLNTNEHNINFLINYIKSYKFIQLFNKISTGSLIEKQRVHFSQFETLKIPLPPLPEQKKIAEILSTWDKAIESTEKLIGAKTKLKQGLMQKLLTGKLRFKEFKNEKWNKVKIRSCAKQIIKKNTKNDSYVVLSCTKYHGLVDSLTYFGRQMFSNDLSTYKVVEKGQFAYATNHIEEGSIGYQNICDYALISPMYTVFETNKEIVDNFLYAVLKTEQYRKIFENNTSGSINRRGGLRWDDFSNIIIPKPSLKEQQKISFVITTTNMNIDVLKQKLKALKEQKKGLMQKLLTGEVRVKV